VKPAILLASSARTFRREAVELVPRVLDVALKSYRQLARSFYLISVHNATRDQWIISREHGNNDESYCEVDHAFTIEPHLLPPQALRDLADAIERERYPLPELAPPPKLERVK
jgi:hypothetical protein